MIMKAQEPPRLKAALVVHGGESIVSDSDAASVEDIAAQLRRRREASYRLPPLADGRRDPLDPLPRRS